MTEQLCESCQEEFEIVENIVIYGDSIYHNKCWDDYCKTFVTDGISKENES